MSIIILAAGAASRMGKPKQLLPFKNSTLLEHSISQALNSKIKEVYCILGANSENIKKTVSSSQITFIDNPKWKEGLSTSIVKGINYLETLEKTFDAVLIMLCDQPFINAHYIDLLMDTFAKNPKSIIASNYGGKHGVPAIFPKKTFQYLAKLEGDKGAKEVLNNGFFNVISVTPKSKEVLKDIDTPEDYESLNKN
ncbi:nucleotidyltransferase family protein [Seonamhaeicola marinus]|uniref:Nucleotidyltransferase family protein n=1 Tax=Seonamhaeicola marinus TaxID=1912246 RepID=A0A5D0JAG0_9FLAO|nr:nucleotidyltransferase family protein [Seonamhaeicola marinus]TYA92110.1 nucleotidyltransferase family protein [Seonamhaeicola marinus]